ncbi:DsbA family oxidoreductase [Aeromicrobium fastidiosum]|uniref:DsbA family oxidoreductase n=1 Tax=Aeromicrobium fastidiosum TaxID=52699 RepID=A0A641AI94_9ACTN|nr:DsbA family oxidoreductase [Aeromicrobium fastidiosum]KAA1372242.1 DsbA family oxidoreductase [Aeromicrobium fastidiosum]MBP2391382.1 putative DsbA family dithiol-disulfide isomerase [Aeromicrobium fastidiosum]
MSNPVKVDIWSDIACPWCFVGKRRFETAAAAFVAEGGELEIEYHSFELAPDTPVDFEGSEVDFLVAHKHMPAGQVEQMLAQMTELAAAEGLSYDFDALQHTNTVKAHELLHFAKTKGRQLDLVERLFAAYFEQGRHVGRVEDLADVAAEIGLDRDEALAALNASTHLPDVVADKEQAMAYGISGVPFFVLDRRLGVSGAQDPSAFAEALREASNHAGASA